MSLNTKIAHDRVRFPLLTLLHPREQSGLMAGALAAGLIVGWWGMNRLDWPLWIATATVLAFLLTSSVLKWKADKRRYGPTAMGVSALVVLQGFHAVEHIVQWFQYHTLNWSLRASTGLLSPANAEWVHFIWNWMVVLIVILLVRGGMRNRWAWLLLIWGLAHGLEHTYLFVRYLEMLAELHRLGVTTVTAQGLAGVLGRDGWLALSSVTRGTFIAHLPGLTTATRLDIHFWWNIGETALLILAANTFMRDLLSNRASHLQSPAKPGSAVADALAS
ncbi:MAG TPA: hypothetical protein VEC96_06510 [Anaerolineae bacterium]|nr:hypothetical protein [Anaerolineae bacterium]